MSYWPLRISLIMFFVVLLCDAPPASAQFNQLGLKLVGTGSVGNALQGFSVALSGDGKTVILGGLNDNTGAGAAWVFTRDSGNKWSQQGRKLVGTGGAAPTQQGFSLSLSADGNTALVGGLRDAWVFTRSGSTWTQQGATLAGSGAVGDRIAYEGRSVALSADGNTALVGGDGDDSAAGATWVFTRSGGIWSQQGPKLIGSNASKPAGQGISVALSADGNTALVGGYGDNAGVGAAWVFTRSGGTWTQQGSKLVGTGHAGQSFQAARWRCPPMATPHLSAGSATTRSTAPHGCSPAAATPGPSRARSWSAPALLKAPSKAALWRYPPTAIPPSSAG
jgi:hypothetical protein